jgi:hypothetical protein
MSDGNDEKRTAGQPDAARKTLLPPPESLDYDVLGDTEPHGEPAWAMPFEDGYGVVL